MIKHVIRIVPIAQLAEHETFNFGVKGSSPFGYTRTVFLKSKNEQ